MGSEDFEAKRKSSTSLTDWFGKGSSPLRFHHVDGSAMAPTLKPGDAVFVLPTTCYEGEGIYLVEDGGDVPSLFRAMTASSREEIRLSFDATPHAAFTMPRERFNERVLGLVVAELRVTKPNKARKALGGPPTK